MDAPDHAADCRLGGPLWPDDHSKHPLPSDADVAHLVRSSLRGPDSRIARLLVLRGTALGKKAIAVDYRRECGTCHRRLHARMGERMDARHAASPALDPSRTRHLGLG